MNKSLIEKSFEKAIWFITKYASQEDYEKKNSYERVKIEGNALVNEGINYILTMLGTDAKTGTPYGNADANLIVGTGSGGADPTDTEATFTAGVKATMEAGYPSYGTDQKITWKSSYGTPTANQAWAEFGVLNAASEGKLLNRKVSDQGTKIEGQVWELELEITLS
jgi:hypothetical protein